MFLSFIPILSIVLLAFVLRALFNYHRGPLSRLPGPWYTHFTGLPLLYTRAVGTSRQHLRHLHKVHGPVVRVGPKEVSINSVDGYYKVHGVGSHCLKAPVFDHIRFSHSSMLFTMRDPRVHSERKRIIGRGFASIKEEQEVKIQRLASQAVANIKNEAEKGQADVYKWWRCLAVDVVSEMSFGKSFNLLHSGGKGLPLYTALSHAGPSVVFQAVLPRRLISLFKWSPIAWLRDVGQVTETIFNRVTSALGELRVSSNCGPSIARHLLSQEVKGKKPSLNDDELSSEVSMLLVAGSDSTATTLTYATWEIVRDPDLRAQIEEEVSSLPMNFTTKDVEVLPLLNSVLEEVLRMYNPAAALVERLVPPTGISVHDWDIPGGTMVYTTGWLISRLDDVFSDPDRFDATRFLNPTPEMKRAHVPFNIGARRCVGMHVARMEILVTLAMLFRDCRGLQLHQDMTDELMTQVGEFFIVPKAGRCNIGVLGQ
ncbi:cytochrome P450 [Fusarium oxysporum]|nr:cytochrome P450 [Fusarium oxysporum]